MVSNESLGKGLLIEESLSNYFIQAGCFVIRGVPCALRGDYLTDVDIWIYERPAAYTRRRIIVDVKNKKKPKVAERLFWVRGLQHFLGVDNAIVATTDKRSSTVDLSRSLGVSLLDGDALSKISSMKFLDRISKEKFDNLLLSADGAAHSVDFRHVISRVRSSMINGLGVSSVNESLSALSFFGNKVIVSHPRSPIKIAALRAFYHCSALAAISLDFMLSNLSFASHSERHNAIVSAVRFGQQFGAERNNIVKLSIALIEKYMGNGSAFARQIEKNFMDDAKSLPAEIIAEFISRISQKDTLFNMARSLDFSAFRENPPSYDMLGTDEKSIVSVFLDFNFISREKFAESSILHLGENFPEDKLL